MLDIAATCLMLTAILAYLNHRFVRMPMAIGVMVIASTGAFAQNAATRAQAALFAGKRHQPFRPALLAHHSQETVVEHPGAQVCIELLVYVLR